MRACATWSCIASRVELVRSAVQGCWRATGGRGLRYSDAAILCVLSLRMVFRLPFPDCGDAVATGNRCGAQAAR